MHPPSRCAWADPTNEGYLRYHDEEWGVPLHDDRALFELLSLEAFQAGLSWATILNKRDAFRCAFDGFKPERIARYGTSDVERLLADAGIVRHRGKIESTIGNARALLAQPGSFAEFVWSFVDGRPIVNRPASAADVPAHTGFSDRLSAALKARGFRFVGSTICYAFMQAAGLVDDHLAGCFRATRVPPA
ncbi:MAG: DNA-3-methyladenine glycosylase I [Vulcanimicrobiaceae bacterium]